MTNAQIFETYTIGCIKRANKQALVVTQGSGLTKKQIKAICKKIVTKKVSGFDYEICNGFVNFTVKDAK